MVLGILQPIGLLALLLLIPFIIIYLRKPKALNKLLPSLMFLSEHKGTVRRSSILQKLLRNLLFLIQLLLLTLLFIALAEPYYETSATRFFEDTIIVMDTSASMSYGNQFDRAKDEAAKSIGRTTTIIASGSPARMILDKGRPDQANARIRTMEKEQVPSDLESALLIAAAQADKLGSGTRVIIITDKRSHVAQSYLSLLVQKNVPVTIIDVQEVIRGNIGIVDAQINQNNVIFTVRNAYPEQKEIRVRSQLEEVATTVGPLGFINVNMKLGQGDNTFTLNDGEGFQFDNEIKIINNARQELNVFIVTNSETRTPSHRAILAINSTVMNIDQNTLGSVPAGKEYDLIIMSSYNPEIILPSFAPNALEMVNRGAMLVITRSRNTASLNQQIMPITIEGTNPGAYEVFAETSALNDGVEFSIIRDPLRTIAKNGTIVLARTSDGNPVVAARPHGSGLIIYSGYDDVADIFSLTPSYPVWWSNLIDVLTKAGLLSQQNILTGTMYALNSPQQVQSPNEQFPTVRESVHLSNQGIYRIGNTRVSALLLDMEESDPATKLRYDIKGVNDESIENSSLKVMLLTLIALTALLLVFIELYYIKKRGDI
jgi:hypothetical protein